MLLTEARMEGRRGRADVFAARLEKLAVHITRYKLTSTDAADCCEMSRRTSRATRRRDADARCNGCYPVARGRGASAPYLPRTLQNQGGFKGVLCPM
ncbi:DUF2732 family protein [Candidatus Symbiopectobacterium endolongispinus]|uniref:DUF2732 family protein n=1 Tax=Candidatus Symbiopectobacterium endolongispinus TaxID=2812664 RepID=UPI003F687905